MALIVWGLAGLTLVLALLSPLGAYAKVKQIVGWLAMGIGIGMSWLLLTPLFYLFFLPFRFLFRRGTRDPMQRLFEPRAPTYWKKRAVETPPASTYERQF